MNLSFCYMLMFISGIISLCWNHSHIMMSLLSLEFIILSLFCCFFVYIIIYNKSFMYITDLLNFWGLWGCIGIIMFSNINPFTWYW